MGSRTTAWLDYTRCHGSLVGLCEMGINDFAVSCSVGCVPSLWSLCIFLLAQVFKNTPNWPCLFPLQGWQPGWRYRLAVPWLQGLCVFPILLRHHPPEAKEVAHLQGSFNIGQCSVWSYNGAYRSSCMHACMLSRCSHVRFFATLWTVAHQVPPLSMGFSRQEY